MIRLISLIDTLVGTAGREYMLDARINPYYVTGNKLEEKVLTKLRQMRNTGKT